MAMQVKRWRAHLAHRIAMANILVASMNLEALGLECQGHRLEDAGKEDDPRLQAKVV